MNGFLPRAWMVSLLLAAPGVAFAQDAPPAEEKPAEVQPAEEAAPSEVKPEEAKPEEKKDEEKKDEAAPAEAAPVEAAPAEAAPVEAAPAPTPTAAPAASAPTTAAPSGNAPTAEASSDHEEALEAKKKAANQLGAAAPVPPDTGRPWQVFATLEASVGQGAFISDEYARQAAIGYAFVGQAFYKIAPLFEGRLDAVGRFSFDQSLTNFSSAGGTRPNEFYFRDLQLGVAGRGLYTEKLTGIVLGASANVFLPTSKPSQALERVLRLTLGVNGARMFSEIGPGNLLITLAEGFRYDFGSASPGLDAADSQTILNSCRSGNTKEAGECATNVAATHWGLTHTLAVTYLVENFSAALSLRIANAWAWDLRDHSTVASGLAAGDNIVVGRSQYAGAEANYSTLTTGALELGYQIIPEVGLSLGVVTEQNPLIYRAGNASTLRFPFFNFSGDADNLSTFYLDVNFQY